MTWTRAASQLVKVGAAVALGVAEVTAAILFVWFIFRYRP